MSEALLPDSASIAVRPGLRLRLARSGGRYALSLAGTIGISAAHFAASILIYRELPAATFGLFSFVIVAVGFALSISGSLLGAPATVTAARGAIWAEREVLLSASAIFAAGVGTVLFGLLLAAGAPAGAGLLFAVYGSVMCLRFFGRTYGYIEGAPLRVTASDLIYSATLIAGLGVLTLAGVVTLRSVAATMLLAALAGLLSASPDYLARQLRVRPSITHYGPIWKEFTRFSLMGVISTELSGNAHAYIVTLAAGPKAFALVALGGLFMRPIGLAISALSDAERAPLARHLARNDRTRAKAAMADFSHSLLLLWLGTGLLAAALMVFAPKLVIKDGFGFAAVAQVTVLWTVVMLVRCLRTPPALLLQAAKRFAPLAQASVLSSVAAVTATFVLLETCGVVASLAGVLIGDLVLAGAIALLVRGVWKSS